MATQHQAGAPPQPGEAGAEPQNQPSPARAPKRKGPPDPKVMLARVKRFTTGVLEHYNKKKKIKFELLDAKPVNSIPEPRCCYTHINFTAKSSKEDSQEQLFFAEIYHKRWAPNGFIVTCCEPLGPDSSVMLLIPSSPSLCIFMRVRFGRYYNPSPDPARCGKPTALVGQKYRQPPEGNSAVRKNADFRSCFACSETMLHPRGENYVAGHCNIPRVYGNFVR